MVEIRSRQRIDPKPQNVLFKRRTTLVRLFSWLMRTDRIFHSGLLAVLLLHLFVQAVTGAGLREVQARVIEVKGKASYSSGGVTQDIKIGQSIPAGSVINTGPASTVILDLGESGRLSVKPDSTLSIDKLMVQKTGADTVVETKLEVRKGSILGNVKKLSSASTYEVATAKGVAGIRGTIYHIFAVGIFRCADGSIVVTIRPLGVPQPLVFTLRPGQQVDNTGMEPPRVQSLAQALIYSMTDGRPNPDPRHEPNPDALDRVLQEVIREAMQEAALRSQNAAVNLERAKEDLRVQRIRELLVEAGVTPSSTLVQQIQALSTEFNLVAGDVTGLRVFIGERFGPEHLVSPIRP